MNRLALLSAFIFAGWSGGYAPVRAQPAVPASYTNSLGAVMRRIPAGAFRMGNDAATDPQQLKQSLVLPRGDYDERPVHDVRITYDFYMSETEVTARQFAQFHEDYQDWGPSSPYASGMSWGEAVRFCEWLSKREKKPYRLPTEAEWEYGCRAGTTGHFSSGDEPPASGQPNAWGLKNMHTDAAEWVLDWHDLYPDEPEVDPVGPRTGYARVVRGGGLNGPDLGSSSKYPNDGRLPYYRRSANRASVSPDYRGSHNIGFRIVEAPLPATPPRERTSQLAEQFVKQTSPHLKRGPSPRQPWFRQRDVLPIPPQNAREEEILAAGLPPGLLGFNHNPGLTVCPNGDLLAVFFSASVPNFEDLANVSIIAVRLRFGSDEWDMPSPFFDFADTKDIAPLLWTEGKTIYHFNGGSGLAGVPFRWQTSQDTGATWGPVHLPLVVGDCGPLFPQPISRGFRGTDGTLYLPSDGVGGTSLLWASRDDGLTWSDTGGRTGGRHTVFAVLKDGSILGMGGKASDIDGFMPKSVSRDGGKTWTVTKTPFPAVGKSQQRPTLLRLASGRLFFAADWQDAEGRQPPGISQRGAYVALSDDEGQGWKLKPLPGVLPHDRYTLQTRANWGAVSPLKEGTLGYTISAQSPNGVIHLVTSCNHPSQHFEMNESWILSDRIEPKPLSPAKGRLFSDYENYPDGRRRASWSGRVDETGRYLLEGVEVWYYTNGVKQYCINWNGGLRTGLETCWNERGRKLWEWDHRPGSASIWTQYWPNGQKKHESHWRSGRCCDVATAWDIEGKVIMRHRFKNGEITEGDPKSQ
jgi:formylglycine-generating enzyme required for sulfatase activity